MTDLTGAQIHISGIVQGVGFRPFVYTLAKTHSLLGWVKNTSAGVDIQVAGSLQAVQAFIHALKTQTPPLARIDSFESHEIPPGRFSDFAIIASEPLPDAFQPISPDVCLCPDCRRELFDPTDRRYHYPFINCTNCGPRFTIIRDIPYDRPLTTMSDFPLCPDCAAEYRNPADRRFHAQPVACPVCGPQVWLENSGALPEPGSFEPAAQPGDTPPADSPRGDAAISAVQELLKQGKIVAIKGLGGFHLACNPADPQALAALRQRKLRVEKPFAMMMANLDVVRQHCELEAAEAELLESLARPIVLLRRRSDSPISALAAPGQATLGVMLPYTPLHELLFADLNGSPPLPALIMTSGNLSEEPIVTDNVEARIRLAGLADAFLLHNRPIQTRCDDSVLRLEPVSHSLYPIRRARGYAPFPVRLPWALPPILAAGAELKNTFCLTNGKYAFLSQHIGDMENYETLRSFEEGIAHFERLFRVQPQAVAYDQHPDYLASRYAQERAARQAIPALAVQHHHAHIAALMAEHSLPPDERVLGLAFDGTGYGSDGAIWGGEFLLAGYHGFQRLAHLAYFSLPGGDVAIRKPARSALAFLWQTGLEWNPSLPPVAALSSAERLALLHQLDHRLNSPLASSMGRLFDAVASLAGIRHQVNYEAQAAIELEACCDLAETGSYPFDYLAGLPGEPLLIDWRPLIRAVAGDVFAAVPAGVIAARFHHSIARLSLEVCTHLRSETGLETVALSGGVWQNITLLVHATRLLRQAGFRVLTHRLVPPNDGGLALGQALIAAAYFSS